MDFDALVSPHRPVAGSSHSRDIAARILIVDDDDTARRTTFALLRGAANEILFAASGAEALEMARTWRPDVVFLDVMMPNVDGFEICRRLRADPRIADTRVFFLTALDDTQSRLTGFEAGADDFLTKPLNREEALVRVQAVARLNRYRSLIREQRGFPAQEHEQEMPASIPSQISNAELLSAFESSIATLHLKFQPIVSIDPSSGEASLFATEGLMRSPSEVLRNPPAILAAAARLRRRNELGRTVRRRAYEALQLLPPETTLFLNVCPFELQDEMLFTGEEPISDDPSRLVFEITERETLTGIPDLLQRIRNLREAGFRFAIDDLGCGYSSLNNVAVIDPEFVKLDQELVRGVDGDATRTKIVSSLIALCGDLGVRVIGEGVETDAESEKLLSLGCTLQQGYLFGRPESIGGEP